MSSMEAAQDSTLAHSDRVRYERDFYRRLLSLASQDEIEPFIDEALSLVVAISSARRGYLELSEDRDEEGSPRFWMAHGFYDDDVAEIRGAFSRGVIAEAITTGRTILTSSALDDPRFGDLGSVQRNRTGAVLCAPIGESPAIGVVYLQDRTSPGPFTDEDRERAEIFARHIAAIADRLLARRRRRDAADPTAPLRRVLRAEGFIGRSAAAAGVLRQLAQAAPLEVGVLLTGPTGVGKTQLARVLHASGPRADGPFVELNCSTLPDTLVESELFGALPGAHSTAVRRVVGKVSAAEGGTLFLDEIGELKPPVQAKLLQLLQSKEYYPLGSPKPLRADVRIVAATNVDLKAAVSRKEFREDLYFRLHVLAIRVPPLVERREDVAELAEHFCKEACHNNRFPELRLSTGALRAVELAEWPGNVRELAHVIEAAAIRAVWEGVAQIERRHVFPDAPDAGARLAEITLQEATRRFQRQFVGDALEASGWNVTEAARRLDVSRAHVYKLIRELGIERPR
jgi:Nif-specific regulatory protein